MLSAVAASPARAAGTIPAQFISKIFTEALGRGPDTGGIEQYDANQYFSVGGCGLAQLKAWGRSLYLSSEFASLGYDNTEKVMTLYQGALTRDADVGYSPWVDALNAGTSWQDVVDGIFDSPEFASLAPNICGAQTYYYQSGTYGPIQVGALGTGFTGTQAQLQTLLNATPSGGTVYLARRAVVYLGSTLTIPAGVTLTTTGAPSLNAYAKMGRLVRNWAPTSDAQETALVLIQSGGSLTKVWATGGRNYLPAGSGGGYWPSAVNIKLNGGTGTTVTNVKSNDTFGGSNIFLMGALFGASCVSATVSNNLVEQYNSNHQNATHSDGISSACGNATIWSNTVVDATDVGIILFKVPGGVQESTVKFNSVYAAGNNAYSALGADPTQATQSGGAVQSFDGTSFDSNYIWTSDRTHFTLGMTVGTKAWFSNNDWGTGASFTNNVTPGYGTSHPLYILVQEGISVSGMYNATVTGNNFGMTLLGLPTPPHCPQGLVVASVAAGWASGTLQTVTLDAPISGCIITGF